MKSKKQKNITKYFTRYAYAVEKNLDDHFIYPNQYGDYNIISFNDEHYMDYRTMMYYLRDKSITSYMKALDRQ